MLRIFESGERDSVIHPVMKAELDDFTCSVGVLNVERTMVHCNIVQGDENSLPTGPGLLSIPATRGNGTASACLPGGGSLRRQGIRFRFGDLRDERGTDLNTGS
jgi:hypothetical protein